MTGKRLSSGYRPKDMRFSLFSFLFLDIPKSLKYNQVMAINLDLIGFFFP